MAVTAIFLPAEAADLEVDKIAAVARANGLGIYFNGTRTALLPHDVPGWQRLGPCGRRNTALMDDYERTDADDWLQWCGKFAA